MIINFRTLIWKVSHRLHSGAPGDTAARDYMDLQLVNVITNPNWFSPLPKGDYFYAFYKQFTGQERTDECIGEVLHLWKNLVAISIQLKRQGQHPGKHELFVVSVTNDNYNIEALPGSKLIDLPIKYKLVLFLKKWGLSLVLVSMILTKLLVLLLGGA